MRKNKQTDFLKAILAKNQKIFIAFFISLFLFLPIIKTKAEVVSSDSDLINWRYDPYPLVENGNTFGNIVYDPVNHLYRLFYHKSADSGSGTIHQKTSSNPRVFGNDTLVLDKGVTAY